MSTDFKEAVMSAHPYDCIGLIEVKPESGGPTYTAQGFNIGFGDILVGQIGGDSRATESPGYPVPSIAQAEAIRAEIIRRWNAFNPLVDALDSAIPALQQTEINMAKHAFDTPLHYTAKSRLDNAIAALALATQANA